MIDRSGVIYSYSPLPQSSTITVSEPEFFASDEETLSTFFDASLPITEPYLVDEQILLYEGMCDIEELKHASRPVVAADSLPIPATATPVATPVVPTAPKYQELIAPQPQIIHPMPEVKAKRSRFPIRQTLGVALVVLSAIGVLIPLIPKATFETSYIVEQTQHQAIVEKKQAQPMPASVPLAFNPLIGPDGKEIKPINTDFSIIVPKIGINAPVIANVDALNPKEYTKALSEGVAHAKSSYLPNQDGATYLFSHSTNYQWFVKDLNAIFYNVKNLEDGDLIVVFYQGKRYTYKYKNRVIVPPSDTTYLLPITGKKMLILQTCWPPGTTEDRLLIFADLIEEQGQAI